MYSALKKICCDENLKLPQLGLVLYTFGNVSIVDRERNVFAIKPSGVNYRELTPEKIVVVSLETGKVVDGTLNPSSDTNTHLELYRAFPNIGSVVHTHSTWATAWAQTGTDVTIYGTTHADHLTADVPCTTFMSKEQIKGNYETATGLQIIQRFKQHNLDPDEIQMVLVAGHGPFTWAKTGEKAVYNARVLEELCKMAAITRMIEPDTPRLPAELINKHYERKHGKNAYYGQK